MISWIIWCWFAPFLSEVLLCRRFSVLGVPVRCVGAERAVRQLQSTASSSVPAEVLCGPTFQPSWSIDISEPGFKNKVNPKRHVLVFFVQRLRSKCWTYKSKFCLSVFFLSFCIQFLGFTLVKALPIGTSAPTVRLYTLSYTVLASGARVGAKVEVK